MIDLNKPLWQLSIGEFLDLQRHVIDNVHPVEKADYTGDSEPHEDIAIIILVIAIIIFITLKSNT